MPSCAFPKIIDLLSIPDYTNKILRGLVVSIGGLSNHVSQEATHTLIKYIERCDEISILFLFDKLRYIYEENSKNDRILTPLIRTLDIILD